MNRGDGCGKGQSMLQSGVHGVLHFLPFNLICNRTTFIKNVLRALLTPVQESGMCARAK